MIVGAFGFSLLRGLVATSQRPGGEGRQVREVIEVDLVCPAFLLLLSLIFFFSPIYVFRDFRLPNYFEDTPSCTVLRIGGGSVTGRAFRAFLVPTYDARWRQ